MDPTLSHLEIRHEMPYQGPRGGPKKVDLWIRPPNGGYAHLIEAGDFQSKKVHEDLAKIKKINPYGSNWFLAFFRGSDATVDPWSKIQKSYKRSNGGLDKGKARCASNFCGSFSVYRPDGSSDPFGFALFRAP